MCQELPVNGRQQVLLDPFAGCGTALVVAASRGMCAVGYEAHPVFEKICRAKLPGDGFLNRLGEIEAAIVSGLSKPQPLTHLGESSGTFLLKLFSHDTLGQLLGARQELFHRNLSNDPLAFLVFVKMSDLSSHSATDGIYKAPTTAKQALPTNESLQEVCSIIRADLACLSSTNFAEHTRIFGESSESMAALPDNSVSIIVTSPPYLNNFDYAEMTRMHLYLWGLASTWGEITDKVRSRLIVNTTTALKGHKHIQDKYRQEISTGIHHELDALVSALYERRKVKAGKKEYDLLVYPYFAQMARVLCESYRVMEAGAPIHIMIADAALYGVYINTHELLASILRDIGFQNVNCEFVRKRGHRWILEKREGSINGLGEYHIRASR